MSLVAHNLHESEEKIENKKQLDVQESTHTPVTGIRTGWQRTVYFCKKDNQVYPYTFLFHHNVSCHRHNFLLVPNKQINCFFP